MLTHFAQSISKLVINEQVDEEVGLVVEVDEVVEVPRQDLAAQNSEVGGRERKCQRNEDAYSYLEGGCVWPETSTVLTEKAKNDIMQH